LEEVVTQVLEDSCQEVENKMKMFNKKEYKKLIFAEGELK